MASDEDNEKREATPIPACIRFLKKGKNDQLLIAAVDPNTDFPVGIPAKTIHEWIESQGCNCWYIHPDAVSHLSREVNRLAETKEYIVAEQKDCHLEVQVSPDRLKAWIRISPAFGGALLTEELFNHSLEERNICFGINRDRFNEILKEGECERELIAEGLPPLPGEKAKFEQLVHESDHKGIPQERKDGSVDYKDLGLFLSVAIGTPLLKRIHPTPGTPGTGVDGSSLPAPMGTDRVLIPGIGTAISKDDPDVIIATRVGQPSFDENHVRVDPTLEVDAVNPSTGNIFFEGNILIRGSVESGYTVKAGLDLTILDTVEGADLIAGRNLVLLTGIYGRSKSKIRVGGNFQAKFLNDCTVHCEGNLEVTDLIAHSVVECEGTVRLGKRGGKGQFYGGTMSALREIQAQIIGSISETTTLVKIAPPAILILRQEKVDKEVITAQKELGFAEREIQSIESSPAGREHMMGRLKEKTIALTEKLEELKKEQTRLQGKLAVSHLGIIRAAKVHRGVILSIGSHRLVVNDEMTDVYFQPPVEE